MRVVAVDPDHPSSEVIREAAELVRRGGLVAFPTETVYGLGANALDPVAIARIYEAKGRPRFNPLIVHAADVEGARRVVRHWPAGADALAARFWPGPLTIVMPKHDIVPDAITAGLGSVAVRVPSHPVALALLRESGVPVAAPSANRSSRVSPTTARHVARSLGDRVDLVLDAGPTQVGIESTVVDLSGLDPVLLRPGAVGVTELEEVLGRPVQAPRAAAGAAPRPSPGMLARHYAPAAEVRLFSATEADRVRRALDAAAGRGRVTGAIVRTATDLAAAHVVRMPEDARGYARELYAALHGLDEAGVSLAFVERVPDGPAWAGIRDRLERAAR